MPWVLCVNGFIGLITEAFRDRGSKFDKKCETVVRKVHISERKRGELLEAGWNFDWLMPEKNAYLIYSLKVKGDKRLQGLIAFQHRKQDRYTHVDIVEAAPHNVGKTGEYIGVGAHLFAIACKSSWDAGNEGFVHFTAKTDLVRHYKNTLGARQISGQEMFIDTYSASQLIHKYLMKEEA